ncbi:MAG: DUF5615 family PIN-like protein [Acidimicrobiaceae bacterium]|nr:DUF5615 family PIN-like protein [Acidimicrobiaceae bacterium]
MRALIDQNLPARFAERMVEAGHDAVHPEVLGLARAHDPEIFAACRDQERVLAHLRPEADEVPGRIQQRRVRASSSSAPHPPSRCDPTRVGQC